jgi:hypothetical protein
LANRFAFGDQLCERGGKRFNAESTPTQEAFEKQGIAEFLSIIRADIYEYAVAFSVKEFLEQKPVLSGLRKELHQVLSVRVIAGLRSKHHGSSNPESETVAPMTSTTRVDNVPQHDDPPRLGH